MDDRELFQSASFLNSGLIGSVEAEIAIVDRFQVATFILLNVSSSDYPFTSHSWKT
jgi:hypothetical protein